MHNNRIINFDKKISQALLNDIINNKVIDYRKYGLGEFKNEILKIKKEYDCFLTKLKIKNIPRYWHFWQIIEKSMKTLIKRLTEKKSNILIVLNANKTL